MPFDWNDFLTLASVLAPQPNEASKRTAISRAYYCVFNLAYARAESKVGGRPQGVPSHSWCWDQYKRTPDAACAQLGNTGDRLKRMRTLADYNSMAIPRLDDQVERVLQEAREFLGDLANLDSRYPRP
jgi:hypothetical protein